MTSREHEGILNHCEIEYLINSLFQVKNKEQHSSNLLDHCEN